MPRTQRPNPSNPTSVGAPPPPTPPPTTGRPSPRAPNTPPPPPDAQLAGVAVVALQGGLGEATVLALCARYPPTAAALTAWSSGTGAAGVFGYLWVAALRVWLRLPFAATLLLANGLAAAWLAAYFLGLRRLAGGGCNVGTGGSDGVVGRSPAARGARGVAPGELCTGGAGAAGGDAGERAGLLADQRAGDGGGSGDNNVDAGAVPAGARSSVDGPGACGSQPGGQREGESGPRQVPPALGSPCTLSIESADMEAGTAERPSKGGPGGGTGSKAGGGSRGGGGGRGCGGVGGDVGVRGRFREVMSLWPYTVPLFVVYAAEYTMQSGAWSAMGAWRAPLRGANMAPRQGGVGGVWGPRRLAARQGVQDRRGTGKLQPASKHRLPADGRWVPRHRPPPPTHTPIPAGLKGFPVESEQARHKFYLYSNWLYQAAVFISRSSGTLLPVGRRGLWAMPALQCALLAWFVADAALHLWVVVGGQGWRTCLRVQQAGSWASTGGAASWLRGCAGRRLPLLLRAPASCTSRPPLTAVLRTCTHMCVCARRWDNWGVLVLCFAAGLLGGATYVNAFTLLSREVPPHRREFGLAAACVADSLGIAVADAGAVFLQGCLLRANGLAAVAVYKCGA